MGKLVVVEGINGAGKSSLIEALCRTNDTWIAAKAVGDSLVYQAMTNHPTSFGMFAAITHYRRHGIRELCRRFPVVLQDRSLLSEATHLPNAHRMINRVMFPLFRACYPAPGLLIFIDTPAAEAFNRIRQRGDETVRRSLTVDNLEDRRREFLTAIDRCHWPTLTLDGQLSLNQMTQLVEDRIT